MAAGNALSLDEAVDEAIASNPEVQASRFRVEAARARIPQAAALEDPTIGFQASNLPISSFDFNDTPMSGKDFSLHQKIPFPGKLRYQKRAEQSATAAQGALRDETENRLRYQVTQAFFELFRIDQDTMVTRKNRALLSNLAKVAEARYETIKGSGPDVFRAQVLESQIENTLLDLKQERQSMEVRFNTLLNRPAGTPVVLRYDFARTPRPPRLPDDARLKDRPLLQAYQHKINEAEQRVRRARREYWPDFDVGLSYRQRDFVAGDMTPGTDFFSGSLSINVPLWAHWRQGPHVRERIAQKMASESEYRAAENETIFQAEDARRRLDRAYRQLQIFQNSLLPRARASYESSFAAYGAELADFFSTIEALKDKFNLEMSYYDLIATYQTDLARLEWVLGEPISSSQEK